jgi:hypothetical protein
MKYKLGDFVRFVDEKMEGFVTRIIDDQMIGVTGDDDFEIPVPASKVTTVHGYQPPDTAKEQAGGIPAPPVSEFIKTGVYLAVVSDQRAQSVVHFHLVNETSFRLLAVLTTGGAQKFKGEFSGMIEAQSTAKLYSAQMADLQLWPKFILHVIFSTAQNIEPPNPLVFTEKFKAKDFSGSKKQIALLKQAGWLIRLDEPEVTIDPQKLKESFFKTPAEKTNVAKPSAEVDLHIEKLRDDFQFLSSHEILGIQLDTFNRALDSAVVHQMHEIVFIHGAGNGILRNELHKALGKHPKVQTFMDAQKEKFGYGATKVLLK